jgi:hypothetical protein
VAGDCGSDAAGLVHAGESSAAGGILPAHRQGAGSCRGPCGGLGPARTCRVARSVLRIVQASLVSDGPDPLPPPTRSERVLGGIQAPRGHLKVSGDPTETARAGHNLEGFHLRWNHSRSGGEEVADGRPELVLVRAVGLSGRRAVRPGARRRPGRGAPGRPGARSPPRGGTGRHLLGCAPISAGAHGSDSPPATACFRVGNKSDAKAAGVAERSLSPIGFLPRAPPQVIVDIFALIPAQ